jgi:hypothetical protein
MAKAKSEKPKQTPPKTDKALQTIYDRIRREFSAADLQKYTVIEPMVPIEQVLAEMEEIHRRFSAKKEAKTQTGTRSKPPKRSKVMPKRKNDKLKKSRPKKDKELQAIYDQIRREFTAADLQKYTEIEEGVPLRQTLAELEEMHRRSKQKRA